MAKITLNNEEFDFMYYNRNTNFNGETIYSNANIGDIRGTNVNNRIDALRQETITSITIENNNTVIYTLSNIDARIASIDESYTNGNDVVITNINIQFN